MPFAHNVRPLGVQPRRTPKSYDSSIPGATIVAPGDLQPSDSLGTRRAGVVPPFVVFLSDLPWYAWAGMFAALCVGACVGGAWGWHEAERAFWQGQSPTVAKLRERLARLRALVGMLRPDAHPRARDVWGELREIEHDLSDLAPSHRRARPPVSGRVAP